VTGKRKALIIANDQYENPSLGRLRSPVEDAKALGQVLGDPEIGAFDVQVVHNEPAHLIQIRLEDFFQDTKPDDLLVLHFSCHGLKSDSGELFFAASNTLPNRLGSTAVPADFVRRCMRNTRSKSVVLLLDCCYGGAFTEGAAVRAAGDVNVLDSFPTQRPGRGGCGQAVITASTSMEYAFEGDRLSGGCDPRPSVFTSALVEGLTSGDADRDEDGEVSLDELYEYVFDRVRDQNPNQTPSRSFDLRGELYLAHSSRCRIKPRPVPPGLRAAMTDANIYTRQGAIAELRTRLISDDLPTAAGARDALQEMAHNDIAHVAETARAALRDATVHPVEHRLDFGQVAQNSMPSRTVELLGPPLARACAFQATEDRIHVQHSDLGLQVSLDTSRQGVIQGNVILKDPVKEEIVQVHAEVTPAGGPPQRIPPKRSVPVVPTQRQPPPDMSAAPREPQAVRPMAAVGATPPAASEKNPPADSKAIWAVCAATASAALLVWFALKVVEVFDLNVQAVWEAAEDFDPDRLKRSMAPIWTSLAEIGKVLLGGMAGLLLAGRARKLATVSNDAISTSGHRHGGRHLNRMVIAYSWAAFPLTLLAVLIQIIGK
jgi:hypothetical protein